MTRLVKGNTGFNLLHDVVCVPVRNNRQTLPPYNIAITILYSTFAKNVGYGFIEGNDTKSESRGRSSAATHMHCLRQEATS